MNQESMDTDLSKWFSSYGLLTSERILERLGLKFDQDVVLKIINNPQCVYYQLLRVPLKSIFNGIILQQAHDYQLYAQKLFIDYLLAGEESKDSSAPGGMTREDIEKERENLLGIIDQFTQQEMIHQDIIMNSQRKLMEYVKKLEQNFREASKKINQTLKKSGIVKEEVLIYKAFQAANIECKQYGDELLSLSSSFWTSMSNIIDVEFDNGIKQDLANVLSGFKDPKNEVEECIAVYLEQSQDVSIQFRGFRKQLYDLVLRVTEFVKALPEYQPDSNKEIENRSSLYFDPQIGEINS